MRKINVTMLLSLNGVIEEPAWTFPYWNDEIARFKYDEFFASDALLLGEQPIKVLLPPGQDILVGGSGALLNTLMQHDLIDVYCLLIYPVVLGSG